MKQKMLKLIKILNKFTLNDILTMSDFTEKDTIKILTDFEECNLIKKISGTEYIYVEQFKPEVINTPSQKQFRNVNFKEPEIKTVEPMELFSSDDELKYFQSLSDNNKKHIVKILTIFKLTENLHGRDLIKYLKELAKKNSDYATSYSSFKRYQRMYFLAGVRGLSRKYGKNNSTAKTIVPPDMYEIFKQYYLSPKKYSVLTSWKMVCMKFPDADVPTDKSFYRLLQREYSPEYIKKLRETPIKLPDLNFEDKNKKKKKLIFEKFIDAANYHYNVLDKKNTEVAICQKGYIKNHLMPYFKGYNFRDITQDIVINYESKMIALGYSMASVRRFLSVFSIIFTKYSECAEDLKFVSDNAPIPSLEISYYTDKEIKEIIKNKKPEFWILCLGVTPAELSALRYEDIDKNNRTVFVQRTVFQGVEQPHRAKYRKRHLKIPSIIFDDIDLKNKGLIFKDIEIDNYDKLINTHIHLLLEKNVQINIISKNLGFHNIKDFELRYNFLLPQTLDENFQIL